MAQAGTSRHGPQTWTTSPRARPPPSTAAALLAAASLASDVLEGGTASSWSASAVGPSARSGSSTGSGSAPFSASRNGRRGATRPGFRPPPSVAFDADALAPAAASGMAPSKQTLCVLTHDGIGRGKRKIGPRQTMERVVETEGGR